MSSSPAKWSHHAMLVASGSSAIEATSMNDMLAVLRESSAELGSRSLVYRVVDRKEVEEIAGQLQHEASQKAPLEGRSSLVDKEETSTNEHNQTVALTAPPASTETPAIHNPVDDPIMLTPGALANAFKRLVETDTRPTIASIAFNGPDNNQATNTQPTRVYLLVNYPASVAEAQALLMVGVSDSHTTATPAGIPVLPLLDGVILVVDPLRELRERRKSISKADERRNSIPRRMSVDVSNADVPDKLTPMTAVSMFQTASPLVKDIYNAASTGGLEWSDMVFVDLACSTTPNEAKPTATLVQDMETALQPVIIAKNSFKEWVSNVSILEIPTWDPHSDECLCLTQRYTSILADVFPPSMTVAAVLFAMKEAVASSFSTLDRPLISHESSLFTFIDHNDIASVAVARSVDLFMNQENNPPIGNASHVHGMRIDAIERTMWSSSDLPGVGNYGRKGMPVKPVLTAAERSVLDTELSSFTTVPVPRVHLINQVLRFEELLGLSWRGLLRGRQLVEDLSREALPQRLAVVLRENPSTVKEYYSPTDSLLFAAINATAPGRFRSTSWCARDHVRHRPALKDWQRELPISDEYLTPRTASAAAACVQLSSGELGAIIEKAYVAYPADQSVVKVYQTAHAPAWLSVSLDGDVFGFRPRSHSTDLQRRFAVQFYASLTDGSYVSIGEGRYQPKKPDGNSTITCSHTLADSTTIMVCSDGTIVQRRHQSEASSTNSALDVRTETYRVISGKGSIVCEMTDGTRRLLFPNGDVLDSMVQTEVNDVVQRQLVVDPETNALVEFRPTTGVVVVTHIDGSRVTYHTDGTRIFATPTRSHVLIMSPGLADVYIDVDVNLTATKHANGEKVAVTKGGLRTRSIIHASDGTEIQVQYNTKVVAEVNGRVTIQKANGTRIVAKDSGRVEFSSSRTDSRDSTKVTSESEDDADRDELSHNSVYYFDCQEGTLQICDHEQNSFIASIGDGRGIPQVTVDLAGVLSENDADKYNVEPIPAKAVINNPIEPYLFVLRGDGSGLELLRSKDAQEWLAYAGAAGIEVENANSAHDSTSSEVWSSPSRWEIQRAFVSKCCQPSSWSREWIQDGQVKSCFDRLQTPVASAFTLLSEQHRRDQLDRGNEFSVVRRLRQLRPISNDMLLQLLKDSETWKLWQQNREAQKDRFRVDDPRSPEAIAQDAAMQRKVVAAYKATRAKKKAERQKLREQQRKSRVASESPVLRMETVQEGLEPQEGGDEGDEDDLDQLFSEESSNNSDHDVDAEIDDPDELMWTAFNDADVEGSGKLTLQQVRRALVQVLGTGISTAEVAKQLATQGYVEPFSVTFDNFADLLDVFRLQTNSMSPRSNQHIESSSIADTGLHLPLHFQLKQHL